MNNVWLVIKDQLPLKRMFHNFFITGNGWGILSKYSHTRKDGQPKVMYNTKETATKVAMTMLN